MQEKIKHYKNNRDFYLKTYWGKDYDKTNFYTPNGFQSFPEDIYKAFAAEIDKDGKVLDLGCGNGLMLKYLMTVSGHKLIPYGVDFMPLSIKQAKEIFHPQHKNNFIVGNVIDYLFKKNFFDFIFVPLHHIHPEDRKEYLEKIKSSVKKNGKIIFYEYSDSLKAEKQGEWIGGYKELKNWQLERKDYSGVSIGVWKK